MSSETSSNRKLFVGNLDKRIREIHLITWFKPYGEITELVYLFDKATGMPRGYAFIEFKTPEQAQKAIHEMNGKMAGGRRIAVSFASDRPSTDRDFYNDAGPSKGTAAQSQDRKQQFRGNDGSRGSATAAAAAAASTEPSTASLHGVSAEKRAALIQNKLLALEKGEDTSSGKQDTSNKHQQQGAKQSQSSSSSQHRYHPYRQQQHPQSHHQSRKHG